MFIMMLMICPTVLSQNRLQPMFFIGNSCDDNSIISAQSITYLDELDQSQEKDANIGSSVNQGHWIAQTFTPSVQILTRIVLKIFYIGFREQTLTCSIRRALERDDLTSVTLSPMISDVREGFDTWIEFDFEDIVVQPGLIYYIVLRSNEGDESHCYYWSFFNEDIYKNGDPYESSDQGSHWNTFSSYWGGDLDFTFRTYGTTSIDAFSDLECQGVLSWTNVTSGITLTENISISNSGSPHSFLSWYIEEYPKTWGDWKFSMDNGHDLSPEDGMKIIHITLITPNEKNTNFIGEIKIVNLDNMQDYEIIKVSLTTMKSKPFPSFLENHHPLIYSILLSILE